MDITLGPIGCLLRIMLMFKSSAFHLTLLAQ